MAARSGATNVARDATNTALRSTVHTTSYRPECSIDVRAAISPRVRRFLTGRLLVGDGRRRAIMRRVAATKCAGLKKFGTIL